jgi:glutaredoxin
LACAGLCAAAFAAEPEPLRKLAARLALQRAEALAAHKLYDRAESILSALAKSSPDLAGEVQKKSEAIAAEKKKADPSAGAPGAYCTALEDARKTGRPFMVFLGRETCGNCQATKGNLKRPALVYYKKLIPQVMLDVDAKENQALESRLRRGKQMRILPFIFYVSPQEEVLDYTSGAQEVEELKGKFQAVLRKCAPVEPARAAKIAKSLKEGNDAMDVKGNCGAAARAYRAIAAMKLTFPAVEEAKASLEIIDQLAESLLKEAQAAAEQKPGDAAACLVILQRDFAGTKAAASAATEFEKIKDSPEVKALLTAGPPPPRIATGDDGEEAARPPAKDTAQDEPAAPDTSEKPKPSASRPDAAKSLLSVARNLLANNRPERAKPILERLLKNYPTSEAAVEAREMLRQLP